MGGKHFFVGERVYVQAGKYSNKFGTIKKIEKADRNYAEFVIEIDGSPVTLIEISRNSFDRVHNSKVPIDDSDDEEEKETSDSSSDSPPEDEDFEDIEIEEEDQPLSNQVNWKPAKEIISDIEDRKVTYAPKIKFPIDGNTPIDYFRVFFPMKSIEQWVHLTNIQLAKDPHATGGPVNQETLLKWIGWFVWAIVMSTFTGLLRILLPHFILHLLLEQQEAYQSIDLKRLKEIYDLARKTR